MVDYDKKIEELTNEIELLRKLKKDDKRRAGRARLDAAINMLRQYNRKDFCFYVGSNVFESVRSLSDRFVNLFTVISYRIKYQGYCVYENMNLSENDIQVAFNCNRYLIDYCMSARLVGKDDSGEHYILNNNLRGMPCITGRFGDMYDK